ncbi:MAG TPA: hypothetical protein VH482_13000 [Thermomicrobiales bacterium]
MSSADRQRAWNRARAQSETERRAREHRERQELLATKRGSDEWARGMARQVMEAAIRGGTEPAVAARRAAEVEVGLIEGQKRDPARSPDA